MRLAVDLLDPEFYSSNPHDAWTWMRVNEPVYRDARNGLWGITRHADIMEVERRSNVFVSGQGYRAVWSPDEINMIAQDDPRHRQQRMLVQHKFTRAEVNDRRPEIDALVTELLDAIVPTDAGRGRCELVGAIAGQLPARLTARLLGYPEDMWPQIKSWSERLMRIDMRERDGHTFAEFMDANMEFMGGLGEVVKDKIGCPADDLLSVWIHGRIDGEPLPPMAIAHEVGLFISGGAETTRTAISHGIRELCNHPDQWDAMAADPTLVPGAVEEVLRWVTPLNNMFRRAIADAEVNGTAIRRGDRIVLLYPSANRDEDVFADPFTFDIRRSPNPQIAFGFGTHLCVGNNLARATLQSLLTQMTARVRDLQALTEPDVEPNIFARAVRSFDVGFAPR
ncbi:MAG: cytochrome [Acidimicrobiales bacterium]|nr:cytochrome [Acidimicrobiales bacterium]